MIRFCVKYFWSTFAVDELRYYVLLHVHCDGGFHRHNFGFMWTKFQKWRSWLPSVQEMIYPIYKKLESIVTNNPETLNQMRQAFFSASQISHFVETERANVVRIKVCWVLNETWPPPACNSFNSNNQTTMIETQCWHFRWSSSPALNIIAAEQLLGFDPILTGTIYSRFVCSTHDQTITLVFNISPDVFPCTPSENDLVQATVLLLTWVSVAT